MVASWTPTQGHINFVVALIASLKEDGIWVVPATGQVYQFQQRAQNVILIEGEIDQTHQRLELILMELGWSMEIRKGESCKR